MAERPEASPVLDLLTKMTTDSIEAANLDDQTLMLVRLGALIAVDAPPASYLMNLGAAGDSGVTADQVQGVVAAVAPIVGTSRALSAIGKMVRAFDLKLDLAELELEG
jgi:alkylhydroperoxidase/carboxymuconolactone decarboxylase family protein YurZ